MKTKTKLGLLLGLVMTLRCFCCVKFKIEKIFLFLTIL